MIGFGVLILGFCGLGLDGCSLWCFGSSVKGFRVCSGTRAWGYASSGFRTTSKARKHPNL